MTKVLRSQYNLLNDHVSDVVWKKTKIAYDVYVKRWIITTMKSYKSFANKKSEPYKQELISH